MAVLSEPAYPKESAALPVKKQISESSKPFFFAKNSVKSISENVIFKLPDFFALPKGQVTPQSIWDFKAKFGEPHGEDYKDNQLIYQRTPILRGAVQKYVDAVTGNGFSFKVEDELIKEEIEKYAKDINLNAIIQMIVRHRLVYGNAYVEVIGNADGLAIRDPTRIYVQRDKFGNILKFNQVFNNKLKTTPDVSFEPNEIAFFYSDKISDSPYGISMIETLRVTLERKLNLEKDIALLLERKANQPYHVQIGAYPEYQANQADVDNFVNELQALSNTNEWVTSDLVKISSIKFDGIVDKFTQPLQHLEQQIFYGTQVPAVLMGMANIPEGLAKEQRAMWDLNVRSIQEDIEKELMIKVFSRRWPEQEIDMIWGLQTEAERQAEVTKLNELLKLPSVPEEIKLAAYKKMSQLLELDVDVDSIELPEEPTEQPYNPFNASGNRTRDTNKEDVEVTPEMLAYISELSKLNPLRLDLQTKYYNKDSIKEAVGWNPHPFNRIIIQFLERENFSDIKYLTISQRSDLRNILKGAVRNEWSIPTIRSKIEQKLGKVILTELTNEYLDRNGTRPGKEELEHLKDQISSRAETIARTEIIRASNGSAMKAYEASNVVESWQFLTAQDERVDDEICTPQNLKEFPLGAGPIPPLHSNCRCVVLPVLKERTKLN